MSPMTLTYQICDALTYEVCQIFICDHALTYEVCEYVSHDVCYTLNDWCICNIPHLHLRQHAHVYNCTIVYECIIVYICIYIYILRHTCNNLCICAAHIHKFVYMCRTYTQIIARMAQLNRLSSSLGPFCHVPLKIDLLDWDVRMRSSATSIAIHKIIARICVYVQPTANAVALDLILESQSKRSLFNGAWQKRPRELNTRLRFDIGEMTLRLQ